MKNILLVLIVSLFLISCATSFKQNHFVRYRDYDIGRHKDIAIHPLSIVEIISLDNKQDKYILQNTQTGCKWVYFVNKESGMIESWEYVSSPDKCTLGVDWENLQ